MGNVELLQGLYQAFAKGDVPEILGALDPKIEWNEAEGFTLDQGRVFIGPDEVLENVFARIPQEFDGFTITPRNFIDGGDTVVVEARYTGKHKASGNAFDAQVAHVFDLKDGKITRFSQYTDTGQFERVTGVRGGAK